MENIQHKASIFFTAQCVKHVTGHTNAFLRNIPVSRFFLQKYTGIPEKYTNQEGYYPIQYQCKNIIYSSNIMFFIILKLVFRCKNLSHKS